MTCRNCGHHLQPAQSFCVNCGQPNLGSTSPPYPTVPVAAPSPGDPFAPFPWGIREVFFAIIALLLAVALAGGVLSFLDPANVALGFVLGSLIFGAVVFPTVWFLGLRRQRLSPAWLGLVRPRTPLAQTAAFTLVALVAGMGFTGLYGLTVRVLGLEILVPEAITPDILLPGPSFALSFFALAVWTPLVEEVFFRGFIFRPLLSRFGLPAALIGSAAVFSLFHALPGVLLPIFVTGMLLAYLYHRTGSLWPPITAHAAQNALVVLYTLIESWQ